MPRIAFTVHLRSSKLFFDLDSSSTVKQLNAKVREKARNQDKKFVDTILALISLDGNEVLDSWLLDETRTLSQFKQRQDLKALFLESSSMPSSLSSSNANTYLELSDFKFLKCIGKGGTSIVFLVRHKKTAKLFALKQVQKSMLSEKRRLDQIMLEKEVMLEMNHPMIAQLKATFESMNHLNFLMDFYPGGELFFHLQQKRLDEDEAKFYFCEILLALEHLHHNRILYRDLKV